MAVLVAVPIQFVHFIEELTTGFYDRFPMLLGLAAWPPEFFLVLNVCFIAVWSFSAAFVRSGTRPALAEVWFLAITAVINGVAHPLLALAAGRYFPGLLTALPLGVAGFILLRMLLAQTASRH